MLLEAPGAMLKTCSAPLTANAKEHSTNWLIQKKPQIKRVFVLGGYLERKWQQQLKITSK